MTIFNAFTLGIFPMKLLAVQVIRVNCESSFMCLKEIAQKEDGKLWLY